MDYWFLVCCWGVNGRHCSRLGALDHANHFEGLMAGRWWWKLVDPLPTQSYLKILGDTYANLNS